MLHPLRGIDWFRWYAELKRSPDLYNVTTSGKDKFMKPTVRVFGMLASDSNVAVLMRIGPKYHTQLILWDRRNDTFTRGQWLKGKVFPERCSLNPDGSLLIYHVSKFHHHVHQKWTAVSHPPYFTALVMWPHHRAYQAIPFDRKTKDPHPDPFQNNEHPTLIDCNGGGVWLANHHVFLKHSDESMQTNPPGRHPLKVTHVSGHKPPLPFHETVYARGVYWTDKVYMAVCGNPDCNFEGCHLTVHGKSFSPRLKSRLEMETRTINNPKPPEEMNYNVDPMYVNRISYVLTTEGPKSRIELEGAVWADVDRSRDRVVFTRGGGLYTCTIVQAGRDAPWTIEERMIEDFAQNTFTEVEPPPAARRW
eukprot:TRINITY_DN8237_c0_g1_i1.p1 TRINITY_DN8237_c0_g1~~TRINITY_DN8237_c0_g1_i1.p1  ORF type:complete len:427 (-),score=48.40 TRINITY_DN8237_c0_g1_i1:87-1175(-)